MGPTNQADGQQRIYSGATILGINASTSVPSKLGLGETERKRERDVEKNPWFSVALAIPLELDLVQR